jgi:hypothetical protein
MHDARALIAKSWKPRYSTGLFNHTRGEPAEGEGGLVFSPVPYARVAAVWEGVGKPQRELRCVQS